MKYFIAVIVIAVVILLGAFVYFKGFPSFISNNSNPIPTESGVAVATPTPSQAEDETTLLTAAIKAALIAEHGADAALLSITVSKIEGIYAQGGASGQGGGGMWLAAKMHNEWKLVWDGNGQINCSDIVSYPGFPKDMVPECWDTATQKIVKR